MEYYEYIVNLVYDLLEDFFSNFTIVSGKTTLRVLYFSIGYLVVTTIATILGKHTYVDIKACILATVILLLINCIYVIQRKDIEKFKLLLKGDMEDE